MESFPLPTALSKRERQVLDIVLRLGSANARDIERELPDPPTYSAVRSILRILTNKGLVRKRSSGGRDCYTSAIPVAEARTHGLRSLVRNFFGGSAGEAACALLGQKGVKLSREEAAKLIAMIKEARGK